MEVSIRPFKDEDLETIVQLQTLSLSQLPQQFRKYDRQQIDSLIEGQAAWRRMSFDFETTLIAEDNDRVPIGFIASERFQITGLFVHPDYLNLGVGSKLLKQIELLAVASRLKTLGVLSSLESIDFYQKRGYQFVRETGFFSHGSIWIPCQLLEKELIPAPPIENGEVKQLSWLCRWLFK
jgi:N-acetylglutamate synthase-like GNAT family acetyltransferase